MAKRTLPEAGFFNKHLDKIAFSGPDDCWLWTACTTSRGYGSVKVGGKMRGVHREAYEAKHGAESALGLVVRHRCDTPLCCNPNHLEVGTHADNARDRDERGRRLAPVGETNGCAKLTDADVLTILSEYVPRSRTHGQVALGRRFGVSHTIIGFVTRREKWTHVAPIPRHATP